MLVERLAATAHSMYDPPYNRCDHHAIPTYVTNHTHTHTHEPLDHLHPTPPYAMMGIWGG
jgi:hypothetical protein